MQAVHQILERYGTVIARVFYAVIFLGAGFKKISSFSGTVSYMQSKMGGLSEGVLSFLLVGAIAFLLIGGFSVLFGAGARFGALLLLAFLVIITPIFHPFNVAAEQTSFMKNAALMGGALMFMAYGPGPFSLDALFARRGKASAEPEPQYSEVQAEA
jgi:putative oxidoreductase